MAGVLALCIVIAVGAVIGSEGRQAQRGRAPMDGGGAVAAGPDAPRT